MAVSMSKQEFSRLDVHCGFSQADCVLLTRVC